MKHYLNLTNRATWWYPCTQSLVLWLTVPPTDEGFWVCSLGQLFSVPFEGKKKIACRFFHLCDYAEWPREKHADPDLKRHGGSSSGTSASRCPVMWRSALSPLAVSCWLTLLSGQSSAWKASTKAYSAIAHSNLCLHSFSGPFSSPRSSTVLQCNTPSKEEELFIWVATNSNDLNPLLTLGQ